MISGVRSSESPRSPWLRGDMWIGPLSGIVGAIFVHLVWRWLNWPYRPEFVFGSYVFISTAVAAYVNGGWKAHPWRVLLVLTVFTALGAMFIHLV